MTQKTDQKAEIMAWLKQHGIEDKFAVGISHEGFHLDFGCLVELLELRDAEVRQQEREACAFIADHAIGATRREIAELIRTRKDD